MSEETLIARLRESLAKPIEEGELSLQIIAPPTRWTWVDFGELWRYRDLLLFLTWRDISVRYKQTFLGVAWAVLQPLLTMLVFTVFFGHLGKIPSDGIPYPIFSYCALVPWQLFAYSLTESTNSLVGNERLITKVYFPRLVIPAACTLAGLVDFCISLPLLLGMMLYYGIRPGIAILTLPPLVLLTLAAALAVGLWLAALNVKYRDVRYTVPFITQLWLFTTPIAYPSSLVPAGWRAIYGLNPMAGVVDGFRWALLGKGSRPGSMLAVSAAITILLLVGGIYYFRQMEQSFADIV